VEVGDAEVQGVLQQEVSEGPSVKAEQAQHDSESKGQMAALLTVAVVWVLQEVGVLLQVQAYRVEGAQ